VPRSKNRVGLHLYSPQGSSWPVKSVKPTYLCVCYKQVFLNAVSYEEGNVGQTKTAVNSRVCQNVVGSVLLNVTKVG
jgi:hypothetical protein